MTPQPMELKRPNHKFFSSSDMPHSIMRSLKLAPIMPHWPNWPAVKLTRNGMMESVIMLPSIG